MTDGNPLRDRRVRGLIGLSGAVVVAFVAIFFLEGTIRWVVLGVALLDAIVTPYILGGSPRGQVVRETSSLVITEDCVFRTTPRLPVSTTRFADTR